MKLYIYAVFDKVAECHSSPLVMVADEVAIRLMRNCVKNPEHNYHLNPEDYRLVKIGTYEDREGTIEPMYQIVIELLNCKERSESEKS